MSEEIIGKLDALKMALSMIEGYEEYFVSRNGMGPSSDKNAKQYHMIREVIEAATSKSVIGKTVEIYIRPAEHPAKTFNDSDIRINYNDIWIDFRDGRIIAKNDAGFRIEIEAPK